MFIFNLLFAPTDSSGSGSSIDEGSLSKDDILDVLQNLDDNDDSVDDKYKDKDIKDDENVNKEDKKEDEDKEEEIKLDEDIDDSKLEYKDVPSRKAILKEFPELFKKFPTLESSFYREQQYSEIYPNIADAKDAKEKAETYENFESSLLSGDIGSILKSVKNADNNAFEKISDKFLAVISELDRPAYLNIVSDITKNVAVTMWKQGESSKNENLQLAAQILHEYLFGTNKIAPYQSKFRTGNNGQNSDKPNDKETELTKREENFLQQKLTSAVTEVSDKVENLIKRSVENHIDPRGQMTDYVKNNCIKDIISELDKELGNDKRFKQVLDNLWLDSGKNDFNDVTKKRVRDALLSKAQTILPGIVKRVKAEALKGSAARNKVDREDDEKLLPRGRTAGSNSTSKSLSSNSGGNGKKESIPRGVSTLDFLNS